LDAEFPAVIEGFAKFGTFFACDDVASLNDEKATSDSGGDDGRAGGRLDWSNIDDGPAKGNLRSGLHAARFEEEKDAEKGESAYDQDDQKKELRPGGVAPNQAVTHSGDHAG
jgi:hypothetical protein